MMTFYYIETDFGCGIREAKNIQQARKDMREEAGSFVQVVRKATEDEIEWVHAMGGYVPTLDEKLENLPSGEQMTFTCETPYCRGIGGKCAACGGIWSECDCNFNELDCACGKRAERKL